MTTFHIILLALLQGITEFLPISSSGHLLLFHQLVEGAGADSASAQQIDLLLDIAVHVGTLFAVCCYFWRDLWIMTKGCGSLLIGRWSDYGARLNIYILISSIPVIIAGLALHMLNPLWLRETWIVAVTTILFGALLWHADETPRAEREGKDMTLKDALLIGLSQCLALIPGTSRSGITMTAARYLGFSRTAGARYSLLLSTVAISGAGAVGATDAAAIASIELAQALLLSIVLSFIAALVTIAVLMKWLEKQSFKVFALYRFALGGVLLAGLAIGWF